MRIPDFFIVGAPKCGTTALYSYLDLYPAVFMSRLKEPHFFATDMPRLRNVRSLPQYSAFFASARTDQICGEASTSYLFSRCAVTEILRVNPRAKLIAMVRNPLEMVIAFHQQQVNSFSEQEPDFETAWRLSEARARGLHVPRGCKEPSRLDYKASGRLGEQVKRLLEQAPKERVHVIVFDEFVAETAAVYNDVLRFLGLPLIELSKFPVVNARNQHRMAPLSKFLMRPPSGLGQLKRRIKQAFPRGSRRVGDNIRKLTQKRVESPKISVSVRAEMVREFAGDVQLLGSLLNRDFSGWLADLDDAIIPDDSERSLRARDFCRGV